VTCLREGERPETPGVEIPGQTVGSALCGGKDDGPRHGCARTELVQKTVFVLQAVRQVESLLDFVVGDFARGDFDPFRVFQILLRKSAVALLMVAANRIV